MSWALLVDNQYHAGWAWAGSTPYKGMKLLASDLGGTRNPLAVRWPAKIAADAVPRANFLHCNDIVPTIYEVVGIEPAHRLRGSPDAARGRQFRAHAGRPECRGRQRRLNISRSWAAAPSTTTAGWLRRAGRGCRGFPAYPRAWQPGRRTRGRVEKLYNLDEDWSQANDLAAQMPEKLAQMREMFAIEAARNAVLPIGGGLWDSVYHPELRIAPPFREWQFSGDMIRMPILRPGAGQQEQRGDHRRRGPGGRIGRAVRTGQRRGVA